MHPRFEKIYPSIVAIVDSWQQLAEAHGMKQTDQEAETLKKYVAILKKLGVLK